MLRIVKAWSSSPNSTRRLGRVEEAFGSGDDGLAQFLSKTLASMLMLMKAMTEEGGDDIEAYMDMAQVRIASAPYGRCDLYQRSAPSV